MGYRVSVFVFLLLFTSCSMLKRAEEINVRYYVNGELKRIWTELETAEPTGLSMKTLYLVDLAEAHKETLDKLARQVKEGSQEDLKIAQLRGDGERIVRWARDEKLLAQGYLLMGNWAEAKRMRLNDPATDAMIYLAEGDVLRAIEALEHLIVQEDEDRMIRLNGARLLQEMEPDSDLALKQIMMLTANAWEQFMANTLLDFYADREMTYNPRDKREEIFVKILEAKRSGNEDDLRNASRLLLKEHGKGYLGERMMRNLRQELLDHELYPEALRIHNVLPKKLRLEFPYSLLEEYADEIALLERYEHPEAEAPTPLFPNEHETNREETFRDRWGDVQNVDNWVMIHSTALSTIGSIPSQKPTSEQYQAIRSRLRSRIPSEKSESN